MAEEEIVFCSFCGKSQHEVFRMIAGDKVNICSECVDLCNEIIAGRLELFNEHRALRRHKDHGASDCGNCQNCSSQPGHGCHHSGKGGGNWKKRKQEILGIMTDVSLDSVLARFREFNPTSVKKLNLALLAAVGDPLIDALHELQGEQEELLVKLEAQIEEAEKSRETKLAEIKAIGQQIALLQTQVARTRKE
jgi:hypothetical protein